MSLTEGDVAALHAMADEFTEAFNTGDVDRLMQFYADTYADQNLRNPVQSWAERRRYYAEVMQRGLRVKVLPDEIVVEGNIGLVRGRIEVRTAAHDAAPTELRYLEVARKAADGAWRVFWGMDGPVQEWEPGASSTA